MTKDLTILRCKRVALIWDEEGEQIQVCFADHVIAEITEAPSLPEFSEFLDDMDAEAEHQGIRKLRATELRALIDAMPSVDDWQATVAHDLAKYGQIGVSF